MKKTASTREAYGKTLLELGKVNPSIVVLDADLSSSTKTSIFSKEFKNRFFNMGIAEQDMVSTAAGFATTGKTVFVSTFAVFCTGRAWDQVKVSVAYPRLNVKIVSTHGGITTGEDGVTHQALEDIGLMRILPNMTIIVPADAVETKKVILAAAAAHGPFYIRLSRPDTPIIYENDNYDFKVGKAITLREGCDATIIACGIMVSEALDAAEELSKEGISCRVINMHTIKPIDKEIIISAAKETKAIITAEEHQITGGLGSAVSEIISENHPVAFSRLGIKDTFAESGKPADLLEKYGLTCPYIVEAVKKTLKR